jgi:predicted nucleotide-binding protein (sugar kinase/HSP70/actin superfamily)
MQAMDVPDNDALQYGREYGNRGQCNPTYFTVGNLVKHLSYLRDVKGEKVEDIVENYLFITAGACGPCRFGTYTTEYRKALRDAGFDGFRVMLFQQQGGLKQATGDDVGLEMNAPFFLAMLKSIIIGDVLNAVMYRVRPYEIEAGATDRAIAGCRELLAEALEKKAGVVKALYKCRKLLGAIEVDRTQVKPKVGIIGEFWAMTTEGDGNYKLQSFLEGEGAEVDVQLVTAWILYMIWQSRYDTERRAELRGSDTESRFGLAEDTNVAKKMLMLKAADKFMRAVFQSTAYALGLYDYHLPDMDELADVSHAFYDNNLRGGEGHMEVGKLILNVAKSKVNMTLSVKPFGCMPSSSVSDGVQSLITEMYPEGIFLPIETNGDGAVNVYSRVQMQLFKAKQHAQREVQRVLDEHGMTMDEVRAYLKRFPRLGSAFHRAPHVAGSTTADLVAEIAARKNRWSRIKTRARRLVNWRAERHAQRTWLVNVAKMAAAKAKARSAVVSDTELAGADPEYLESIGAKPTGKKTLRVLN